MTDVWKDCAIEAAGCILAGEDHCHVVVFKKETRLDGMSLFDAESYVAPPCRILRVSDGMSTRSSPHSMSRVG